MHITLKTLTHNIKHFFTILNKKEQTINLHQKYFNSMIPFTILNKKEQAINLHQKYFNSIIPFTVLNKK